MQRLVAVTYEPPEEEEVIYGECVGDLARIVFLPGLTGESRARRLEETDVLVSRSFAPGEISQDDVPRLARVAFIQLLFAGADNVPFGLLPRRITVASNAGAFAEPIAEHVLAMALALAKSLRERHELLAAGRFDQSAFNRVLRGGVCGIIGFGGNGKAVAKVMQAVGMKVYGINRRGDTDMPVDFIGTPADLRKVLAKSDVVVLTLPLTRETRDLIGRRELNWMKKDASLINVARGGIINERALYEHMEVNPDFRVGIDTWWSEPSSQGAFKLDFPFFQFPNFIGSPHVADHVPGMMAQATKRALNNVRNHLLGKRIHGIVNRRDYTD